MSVHSSIDEHLGCFQFLAIENNASVNPGIQVFVLVPALNFLSYVPRSAIAESYDNSTFTFLRTVQTVFPGGDTILHFIFLYHLCSTYL